MDDDKRIYEYSAHKKGERPFFLTHVGTRAGAVEKANRRAKELFPMYRDGDWRIEILVRESPGRKRP